MQDDPEDLDDFETPGPNPGVFTVCAVPVTVTETFNLQRLENWGRGGGLAVFMYN